MEQILKKEAEELVKSFYERITAGSNLSLSFKESKRRCTEGIHCNQNYLASVKCAIFHVEALHQERRRAVGIAYEFRDKHSKSYDNKRKAGYDLAFIEDKIAEECRYVGNAISGQNALSVALKKPEHYDGLKIELEKMLL
jgi:hypothetical protein